jgi:hypothetical protein
MFAPLIFVVAASTPAPSTHGMCTLADFNGDVPCALTSPR